MNQHSVIFCGTPGFAVFSLRALHGSPLFRVTHVITQPDRPVGRSQELSPPPVKVAAEELGIPVWQPENINTELAAKGLERPDFLVVVAYGKIVSKDVLAFPKIAPVNVHASILPRWRGASPVQHAILNGDERTGVTIQIMTEALDAGDVLGMIQTQIGAKDTTDSLKERLARIGAELLVETLSMPLNPVPQPKEGITMCGKIEKEDGTVDTKTFTAIELDRRVRAFTPWPGVQTELHGKQVKILSASLEKTPGSIPLECKDGTTLFVADVIEPGKKALRAEEWLRGVRQ